MIWDLEKFGNNTALIEGDASYSYSCIKDISSEIASKIQDRSLVFLYCSNTLESICGYVACMNNDKVPYLADAKMDKELSDRLIDLYHPSYLWVPKDILENFERFGDPVYEYRNYALLQTNETPCPIYEELALLVSTSGSTGSPKFVRLSAKNVLANTQSIVSYLQIDSTERAITSLPMNYVYGLSVINTHLYAGASLVLTEYASHMKQFWQLFNEQGCTSFAGVPFMYEILDKLGFAKSMKTPTLRTMTQAGGKLSGELQKKFVDYAQRTGKKFVIMYGASEATARMGYLPFENAAQKANSMGVPIPGGRFELEDQNGEYIDGIDEVGELIYFGDNVSLGYAEQASDLALEDLNKGRLATGDMAKRDEDGFYYIVGRKKRFVKMLGKRTNLDELDSLLKSHFESIDIVCTGKDDSISIFVVDEGLKAGITDYVFKSIGINRGLFKVICIDEIPRNESGKVLFSALPQ